MVGSNPDWKVVAESPKDRFTGDQTSHFFEAAWLDEQLWLSERLADGESRILRYTAANGELEPHVGSGEWSEINIASMTASAAGELLVANAGSNRNIGIGRLKRNEFVYRVPDLFVIPPFVMLVANHEFAGVGRVDMKAPLSLIRHSSGQVWAYDGEMIHKSSGNKAEGTEAVNQVGSDMLLNLDENNIWITGAAGTYVQTLANGDVTEVDYSTPGDALARTCSGEILVLSSDLARITVYDGSSTEPRGTFTLPQADAGEKFTHLSFGGGNGQTLYVLSGGSKSRIFESSLVVEGVKD